MEFGIQEIKNKEIWESFILDCQEKTFLQAWNWGEFQGMMGNKIWRLGIFDRAQLIALAQVLKIVARRGTFLFIPHGPVVKSHNAQIVEVLSSELKKIAREEGAHFIRISPILERNNENIEIFKGLGFREAPIHMHPEETWELDITLPEEELLMQMRKTTRYLIRQAQKDTDIEITKNQELEDLKIFNELYQETVNRHHFVPFSFEYLKNESLAFLPDGQIRVFLGKYKGEVISSAIVIFWQNIAFYHHGASSLKYPKIPVSYFLQWEAIKEAKKRDCQLYNFWGIAPENNPKHPWAGLTLFKMGFGGYKKEYVKTQDLPLSQIYWLTYFFERLRKIKRGF